MQPVSLQADPPEGEWYPSLVLDFEEDRHLVVGVPTHRGEEVPVEAGSVIGLEFPLPDGLRRFVVEVRRRDDSPPALYLGWPQTGERIQRRDHVRVPAELNANVRVVSGGRIGLSHIAGITSDVSGGGLRLNVPDPLADGAEIEVRLDVPEAGWQTVQGRVLRSGTLPVPQGPNRVWLAVEFTSISEPVRRVLTKLVFEIQRDQLRRGG